MIPVAKRMQNTQEYYFSHKLRQIERMNQEGKKVINLGIGSPDLMPPEKAIEKLVGSGKEKGVHSYQSYKGIPELRKAFTDWYSVFYGVKLNPENEVLPLIGSKEGIAHISMTYLDEGDSVLIPDPGYPAYATAARLAGAETVSYDLKEDVGWLPDLDQLARRDLTSTKIMWINYPHMPTGTRVSISFMKELISFAKEQNILICHDNPYSFILNDQPMSILSIEGAKAIALELNSLSKSHNMAGWRMGVVAGHSENIKNILRYKSNIDSGMFLPIQLASIEALKMNKTWYERQNEVYRKRRESVWNILETLNCSFSKEQSGMFVWAKAPEDIGSVEKWVDEILQEAKVFITPGFIFGSNGSRFIRISLCNESKTLEEALRRILSFTKQTTW